MSEPSISILDTGYETYAFEETAFREAGYRLRIFQGDPADRGAKLAFAAGSVGILLRGSVIDDAALAGLASLQAIVRYGVGYDNIDLEAAARREVRVSNVQGYADHAVSDHALALMLACARALPEAAAALRSGFSSPPRRPVFELHDKTLGIVGLGRIGGTLCRKASGLFARVLAADPYIPASRFAELGAEGCSLPSLLERSHVISLHCNLTTETTRLIDADAFRRMSLRPILVNTARGPVIDEKALLQALEQGRLHSAAVDVFGTEPPTEEYGPLLGHPHLLATGHYAWYSENAQKELQRRATRNMLGLLSGAEVADRLA